MLRELAIAKFTYPAIAMRGEVGRVAGVLANELRFVGIQRPGHAASAVPDALSVVLTALR